MDIGKITEGTSNISEPSEIREFPELRREKQSISLFGCEDCCFVIKDEKLSVINPNDRTATLLSDGVQGVAGGKNCYAFIKSGKVNFFENWHRSNVFDGLSDIVRIASDGKRKFYLLDSSVRNFCFDTSAPRSRKVLDKEIVSFDDYTEIISTVSSREIQQLKSKSWAEHWVKSTEHYKVAVGKYGEENVGIKIYDSDKKVLDDSANYKVIISVSFSVFTVRKETVSPVVFAEDTVCFPEADKPVYIDGFMYTDPADTELFINCPIKKAVYVSTDIPSEVRKIFSSSYKPITKKPKIIKNGIMLKEDGTLMIYDSSSHSWKKPSFPIKNICDIALFGKKNNEFVAVSKTNGEIIITQYSTLLTYYGQASSINIIRIP